MRGLQMSKMNEESQKVTDSKAVSDFRELEIKRDLSQILNDYTWHTDLVDRIKAFINNDLVYKKE